MVENPAYKGPWEQKDMANPDYFHEANPFSKLKPFDAIAFELVVNDPGLQFDNVYFSSNVEVIVCLSFYAKPFRRCCCFSGSYRSAPSYAYSRARFRFPSTLDVHYRTL